MILVTGTPRSGTLTVSWLLRQHGYDCPHERLGKHGTVSCYYVARWREIPWAGKTLSPHEGEQCLPSGRFNRNILLVRRPLACIASMSTIVNYPHIEWMQRHGIIPDDMPEGRSRQNKIRKLMWAWYNTNERLAKYELLRTNKIQEDWERCFGWRLQMRVPVKHRSSGYRKAPKLTWRDLDRIDSNLTEMIRGMSHALDL